jgi:hypothetical protein
MPVLFGPSAKALVLNTTLSYSGSTKLVLDLPVVMGSDVTTEQYLYVNDHAYLWSACLRLSGGNLIWETGSTAGTGTKTSYVKTYVYTGLTLAANTFYHITIAFDYANGCDSPILAVGGAEYTCTPTGTRASSTTLGGTQFAIGGRTSVQAYTLVADYYINDKPFLGTILEVGYAYVASPVIGDLKIISMDGRTNALGRYYGDTYYWPLNQLPIGTNVSSATIIRPNSDVSNSGFLRTPTGTPLSDAIDEVTLDTADYVSSSAASASCEFGFGTFTKSGTVGFVKVSLDVAGTGCSCTHQIKNVTTQTQWSFTSVPGYFMNFISIQELSQAQIDAITLYITETGGGKTNSVGIRRIFITAYELPVLLQNVQHVSGTSGTYFVGEPGATGAPMTNLIGGN